MSAAVLQRSIQKAEGIFPFRCNGHSGSGDLKADFIWLELLPTTGNPLRDARNIRAFQRRMRQFELSDRYCLLLLPTPKVDKAHLDTARFYGVKRRELEERLAGPNTLLNLSFSIVDPLVERFERRVYCSLDPTEICFWMRRLEMGQSPS